MKRCANDVSVLKTYKKNFLTNKLKKDFLTLKDFIYLK